MKTTPPTPPQPRIITADDYPQAHVLLIQAQNVGAFLRSADHALRNNERRIIVGAIPNPHAGDSLIAQDPEKGRLYTVSAIRHALTVNDTAPHSHTITLPYRNANPAILLNNQFLRLTETLRGPQGTVFYPEKTPASAFILSETCDGTGLIGMIFNRKTRIGFPYDPDRDPAKTVRLTHLTDILPTAPRPAMDF